MCNTVLIGCILIQKDRAEREREREREREGERGGEGKPVRTSVHVEWF